MDEALAKLVRERARGLCEYCHAPQAFYPERFQIDHVIARQHGGETIATNLAFACMECNAHKGTNLTGIDPDTGAVTPLFHPRADAWTDHFEWDGAMLVGLTPVGKTTVRVLAINRPMRVIVRETLTEEGVVPPVTDRLRGQ